MFPVVSHRSDVSYSEEGWVPDHLCVHSLNTRFRHRCGKLNITQIGNQQAYKTHTKPSQIKWLSENQPNTSHITHHPSSRPRIWLLLSLSSSLSLLSSPLSPISPPPISLPSRSLSPPLFLLPLPRSLSPLTSLSSLSLSLSLYCC